MKLKQFEQFMTTVNYRVERGKHYGGHNNTILVLVGHLAEAHGKLQLIEQILGRKLTHTNAQQNIWTDEQTDRKFMFRTVSENTHAKIRSANFLDCLYMFDFRDVITFDEELNR